MRNWQRYAGLVLLAGATALAANTIGARAADPNALWNIVHGRCVPDQTAHNEPAPCAHVDLGGGFAVLKDIVGATQYLLIPTARVTGIEDPQILAADAPNYWLAAWEARRYVEQRAPAPLAHDDILLAINSEWARSQNQLHIHVDCVRADVRDALRAASPGIGPAWTPIRLADQDFAVRRLEADALPTTNIFALVAQQLADGEKLDSETIVLAAAINPDGSDGGFNVLMGRAGTGGSRGHGEDLQDHTCAVAGKRP